MKKLNVPEEKL